MHLVEAASQQAFRPEPPTGNQRHFAEELPRRGEDVNEHFE